MVKRQWEEDGCKRRCFIVDVSQINQFYMIKRWRTAGRCSFISSRYLNERRSSNS